MTNFGDFQLEIYIDGLSGVRPALPIGYAALEARAAAALSPEILSYVAGGAGNEHTQRANVAAFDRLGLIPRMLAGAAERDLSVELFGIKLPTPLLLAPIGVIGLCAQDGHGDLATARASARTGVPMIASTLTVDPLEQVAGELGETPGFFQLYTPADRELAASFVKRAEAAGFKGIVVTLDTQILGWRPRDLALASFPQLQGKCLANYFSDPLFRAKLDMAPEEDPRAAAAQWAAGFSDPALSWDDLAWLRSLTDLPLLLKGICHPDDVRRAIDGGVDGIYCSTHGGPSGQRRRGSDRHAPRSRAGGGRGAGHLRLRRTRRRARREGACPRRHSGRDRPALRLGSRPWRRGRDRSRAALPARRDRPADGRRRLPHDRRAHTRRAHDPALSTPNPDQPSQTASEKTR